MGEENTNYEDKFVATQTARIEVDFRLGDYAPLTQLKVAELEIPVMFHTADPDGFFASIDRFNNRCRTASGNGAGLFEY